MKQIRPIAELGSRIQEAGRIRLGKQVPIASGKNAGKKRPTSIETFRFTSPHRELITELAGLYGGEPREWHEPKARHPDQWEVISEASSIPVLVPPGGMSQFYEFWEGSGCLRRCDGETCTVPPPKSSPDEERVERPCICMAEQARKCEPKTRLTVVLPDITFRGTWRCDTGSWFAAQELPAVEEMLDRLQQTHVIVEANLALEQRQQMTASGKRKFVLPVLSIPHTFTELAGGGAQFAIGDPQATDERALGDGATRPALSPAPPAEVYNPEIYHDDAEDAPVYEATVLATDDDVEDPPRTASFTPDDDVVDAEVVESAPSAEAVSRRLAMVASQNDLDRDALETATALGASDGTQTWISGLTDEERSTALEFLSKLQTQELVVKRFDESGRAIVKRLRNRG